MLTEYISGVIRHQLIPFLLFAKGRVGASMRTANALSEGSGIQAVPVGVQFH